jgi:hypothetical protein
MIAATGQSTDLSKVIYRLCQEKPRASVLTSLILLSPSQWADGSSLNKHNRHTELVRSTRRSCYVGQASELWAVLGRVSG